MDKLKTDQEWMDEAIRVALEAEADGNLPIGSIIVLDNTCIAEGHNAVLKPHYYPGGHAEIMALAQVASEYWPQARDMTCYSTLEPCMMCFGALLLHGVGRVVYGAKDELGGGEYLLNHLPEYYDQRNKPQWVGPIAQERCAPFYKRAHDCFVNLPCGQ